MKQAKLNKTRTGLKKQNIIQIFLIIALIIVLNILSYQIFHRFDLTKEKRFSLSETSKEVMKELDDVVYIEVFLESEDLPVQLIRYRRILIEFLDNLKYHSDKIEYEFKNPFKDGDTKVNREVQRQLYLKGLNPTYIRETKDGGVSERMIFAGALVKYKGQEFPVNLLNSSLSSANKYTGLSETELERDFIHAIWILASPKIQKIAFLEENEELSEFETYDIMLELSKYYQIDRVIMNDVIDALDDYSAVVIAKPRKWFSERQKFIIDQYIMRGGKVLWLVEWMHIEMDSLSHKTNQMAMIRDINLDDIIFNYGVRINPDLIQDLRCLNIPVVVNTVEGNPEFAPMPWFYFPLIIPDTLLTHPLIRNIEPMRTHFVSSIDTVGLDSNIKKTILLRSSQYSKTLIHPIEVSLETLREAPDIQTFNEPSRPVAVLLEGTFTSNYVNRLAYEFYESEDYEFIETSVPTKMIVISDGDFIRNEVQTKGEKSQPYPLGWDKYYDEQYTPGNVQFILNCINYLCADDKLISLRMREQSIRILNQTKVKQTFIKWMWVNSVVPVIIILTIGLVIVMFRRIKYSKREHIIAELKQNKK
jgi:ABC-2 type transport system permease protein